MRKVNQEDQMDKLKKGLIRNQKRIKKYIMVKDLIKEINKILE